MLEKLPKGGSKCELNGLEILPALYRSKHSPHAALTFGAGSLIDWTEALGPFGRVLHSRMGRDGANSSDSASMMQICRGQRHSLQAIPRGHGSAPPQKKKSGCCMKPRAGASRNESGSGIEISITLSCSRNGWLITCRKRQSPSLAANAAVQVDQCCILWREVETAACPPLCVWSRWCTLRPAMPTHFIRYMIASNFASPCRKSPSDRSSTQARGNGNMIPRFPSNPAHNRGPLEGQWSGGHVRLTLFFIRC